MFPSVGLVVVLDAVRRVRDAGVGQVAGAVEDLVVHDLEAWQKKSPIYLYFCESIGGPCKACGLWI